MTDQRFRNAAGGRIDRSRPLTFQFNGRRYDGFGGDTLASALLANGVRLVGRSFKYHRPRGIVAAGSEESNALVQLGTGARTEPNVRATQAEMHDELSAASVNCWPSVEVDVGAINSALAAFLPAGFYYKTFMWPPRAWRFYEWFIRRAAGLGRAPTEPDPDRYEKTYAHCDVAVVGAGPAGLAAALAAGRVGARVILADESSEFGGSLLGEAATIAAAPALDWVAGAMAELAALPEVRLLPRTTVFGYYDHNHLGLIERVTDHLGPRTDTTLPRQRLWKVLARQVVLATGAIERPLVFDDNDRPGVMLASAARTYANRWAVRAGDRAIVVTNNDSAYPAALDLSEAGVNVQAVIDARETPPDAWREPLRVRGIDLAAGRTVAAALGRKRVEGAEVYELAADGSRLIGAARCYDCDLIAVSGGWSPTLHLFSQSGGRPRFDAGIAAFVPGESRQAERSVGAARGTFSLAGCLAEGFAGGAAAALACGFGDGVAPPVPATGDTPAGPLRPLWRVPTAGHGGKAFVDAQNDVTADDVELAAREGYRSVEHLKRYTTTGMGTDQGKTSNVNALAILADLTNATIAEVGTTTFRPPYTPVTYGALAGRSVGDRFDPVRMTGLHQWHEAAGALFEDVGQWKRPWYYPRRGETLHQAVARECGAVRASLGIVDASTLGKIDIQGPDALKLLNLVYTNAWDNLEVGRCRYGLMLKEDGMVFDDGVTARLGPNHYHMTTTTGGAARVMGWLEEWVQCEWLDMRVHFTSTTTHWTVVAIAGPNARRLLAELCPDIDLESAAFPFMAWRDGTVAGIPARVFRVSFSGEQSYEINVPSSCGVALWQVLMTAGAKYDITPYGTETMHVLRAEKGFVIVGQETDGTTTPQDLGMDWIVSKKKTDFIGKRGLTRADCGRADRKQLVGLLPENSKDTLQEGAQIVAEIRPKPPMPMEGHVTSSYWSAALGRPFALALLMGGRARHGQTVAVSSYGTTSWAKVVPPIFWDKEGERLRG
ncbi:MAG: sarcosine oxidase subunit alpha family protein [Alphaproteobacteria bacterium]|nr:sarcosine oxidase subunit alpha family protein [Alphaproteobacteria bacterium]